MITAVRGRSSKQSYILWNGIAISVLNCRLWNPQNLKLITDFQRGEPKRRISKQWKGISFWAISLRSLSDRLSPFRLLGSAPNPRKILTDVFDCRPKSDKPCANRRKRNAAGSIAMIPPAFFFPAGDRSLYILRNTKNQRRLFCTIFRRFAWLKTIQIDNFIVI